MKRSVAIPGDTKPSDATANWAYQTQRGRQRVPHRRTGNNEQLVAQQNVALSGKQYRTAYNNNIALSSWQFPHWLTHLCHVEL